MQSLKGLMLFGLMAVFIGSVASAPAHAQMPGIVADVPFDFSVGSNHLQAGNYRIETTGAMNVFVTLSQTGGKTTYSLYNQGGRAAERKGQPYLVFTRYGADSFLTKIVISSNESYEMPLTGQQKEILAQATSADQVNVTAAGSR
jgi:hypothetical protein